MSEAFSLEMNSPFTLPSTNLVRYEPTWESLDSRKIPEWYDDAKIGIFIHWGIFSVPSFGSEWFWEDWKGHNIAKFDEFMKQNFPPHFSYQEFAKDFTAEFFNPYEWAELFKKSGAKYVVLTSKHHEGFTLWPSRSSFGWNSVDIGPHRDLIGDLQKAIRETTALHFGVYHSLYEWYNPMYLADKENNFVTSTFVKQKILPEMMELVEKYKPEIFWSDGEWEATDEYWQSKHFLSWLYNDSPVRNDVVTNDRWGKETPGRHGGFYTCRDRHNPGILQQHKWENAVTIDSKSWGYRRNADLQDYLTTRDLVKTIVQTISCGGNILINVGPTKDGVIIPIFQERLLEIGTWLSVNGEAIYGSKPWVHQKDSVSNTWYTRKGHTVYAITLDWPEGNVLALGSASTLFKTTAKVVVLGNLDEKLKWSIMSNQTVGIYFPDKSTIKNDLAWVLKVTRSSTKDI